MTLQLDPSILSDIPPELNPANDPAPRIGNGANEPGDFPTVDYTGPLTKEGRIPRRRGRKPGSGSATRAPGRPRNPWPKSVEVEAHLLQIVHLAGTALIFVNAEDSRIILTGGPNVIHELVELAKTEPALRRYLEMSATPGKYGPLVIAVAGVAIPIMVNHNLVPSLGMFSAANDRG